MHLKRQRIPKSWPIEKKGTSYVVRPNFNLSKGIPLLIVMRDLLKLSQNRKEVKKAIHQKNLLINGKIAKDEKNSLSLFDVLTIVPSKKSYRLDLSKSGKFELKEIEEKDSIYKVSKIINKKLLKNKRIQINLREGFNFISPIKCGVNDSVLINLKDKKIEKCLDLVANREALVFSGKHSGKRGIINDIDKKNKKVELKVDKNNINVLIKQLMVIN